MHLLSNGGPQLVREVVPDAWEGHQARAVDGSRGGTTGTGTHDRVLLAVKLEELVTDAPNSSIWLRPERSGHGPAPEYSRAQIARAGVAIADDEGFRAVTMRSAAAAMGAGPASLYRYVATRDELVELMIDHVNGEFSYDDLGSGQWLSDLLTLAHQGRAIYLRHPWLLDALGAGTPMGPNAVTYLEHALAALSEIDAGGQVKLEAIGMFSGVVRLLASREVSQQRAGETASESQSSLTHYLTQVVAAGQHPHLAAALAARPDDGKASRPETVFNRTLTRILTGLLQPLSSHEQRR
jgi:Bacterial regulatory proteins, tetR family./Tetracyclin repressor, C-terminal all-alpha domain.